MIEMLFLMIFAIEWNIWWDIRESWECLSCNLYITYGISDETHPWKYNHINTEAGVNADVHRRMKVSLRDITIVQDETGDGVRVTSCTGSAQRFVENWKKVRELNTRCQTRRIDFWSSQTLGELAPCGGRSRWGPNE